jgi:homoserine dehydrogenase
VAQAERGEDGAIRARVAPEWLEPADPLYNVGGVDNALCVSGDLVGQVLLAGPGAGSLPTASAVIEDVVKLACALCKEGQDRTAPLAASAV